MNLQGLSPHQVVYYCLVAMECEEFCSKSVDQPQITMMEGDQSALNSGNQERKFVGGGGGGQLTVNLERICDDFGRSPLKMLILGGQSTVNLERICDDFGRSPLTMLILGWINSQLGNDPR